jgi:pseudouridylate synthase / pseudouridine kinase
MVAGCSAVDISAKVDDKFVSGSTIPGLVQISLGSLSSVYSMAYSLICAKGGVGRNVAEACHRLLKDPSSTLLVSPVGQDSYGQLLVDEMSKMGMRTDGILNSQARTAACNMIFDETGDLVTGVADMHITSSLDSNFV